ncbi:MAG: hypothetical protein Q9219_005576 [cf. Caloplaca sp. 3 TL-2023]
MTVHIGQAPPDLPFPIYQISATVHRYVLYDINTITWLRRAHNILGVLIGSLPQSPQQNVFLGLPLELQPEEVTLLVEKRLAFVVNDLVGHELALELGGRRLRQYKATRRREGLAAAEAVEKQRHERTQEALQRLNADQTTSRDDGIRDDNSRDDNRDDQAESLFNGSRPRDLRPSSTNLIPYSSTPTTSYPPLQPPSSQDAVQLPDIKGSAYALFKHLHSLGYFMSPGLRFGCQFLVYPGDPLRFHSHFLAVSAEWDEDVDLLDIIGGGRLGTGVKKGWLIGGIEKNDGSKDAKSHSLGSESQASNAIAEPKVRTFCIEWGGM